MRAFRRLLRDRSPLGGTFLDLGSACSAEIAARAGFDFVVADLEHGNGDVADARMQIHAAAAFCGVLVRVAGAADPRIGSVLDYGADGIVVPRIRTAEEASVAASAARFGVARGLSPRSSSATRSPHSAFARLASTS